MIHWLFGKNNASTFYYAPKVDNILLHSDEAIEKGAFSSTVTVLIHVHNYTISAWMVVTSLVVSLAPVIRSISCISVGSNPAVGVIDSNPIRVNV